jgi:hypothetical protein
MRAAMLSLAFILGNGICLQGQDLWDSSFNLSAGMMSGADTAGLGQNKTYGLGIVGAYPVARHHLLIFEGGYRVFPTTTQTVSGVTLDDKTDGYFGGIAYRYRFTIGPLNGLHFQAGLRHYNLRAQRDTIYPGAAADGTDLRTVLKGGRATSTKPVFGAGFRFTENLSLELNLAGLQAQNVQGQTKSGTVIELVLGMHL